MIGGICLAGSGGFGGPRSSGSGSSGGRPSIARSIATSRRAASDGGGAGWQIGSEAGRGMPERMVVNKSQDTLTA